MNDLLETLQYRAAPENASSTRDAFRYLDDGERISGTVTFAELDRKARSIAANLQKVSAPGDRVLLILPASLDYVLAFIGCIYAGAIAVPALAPSNARTFPRLQFIAEDARATVALTSTTILDGIGKFRGDLLKSLPGIRWLALDRFADLGSQWERPRVEADDTLFLQYTSGSTGAPKGVMVSHANALANIALIKSTYGVESHDTVVSWLPPFHDLGLIGGIMLPAVAGCCCVQFPPSAFLMRPYRWLKAIADFRSRITGAPNFAYELCINKVSATQKQTLDLSCWEIAVNGAERVRHDTLKRFVDAFSGCGFRAGVHVPSYGLAESTLLVSANANARRGVDRLPPPLTVSKASLAVGRIAAASAAADSLEVVSLGPPRLPGHQVKVVDPASSVEMAQSEIGEIWVQGPSVSCGYWNRPQENEAVFGGRLRGEAAAYLRTGDLGFIHDDELYVTGRIKELMIFNGRNIYPPDVEETMQRLDPAFRVDGCAVFSLEEGRGAHLVIVQELEGARRPSSAGLVGRVREEVAERHEIFDVAAIVLVRAGHIPRTSSGKIQRGRCKELYVKGELAAIWSWQAAADEQALQLLEAGEPVLPRTEVERGLEHLWREILGVEKVSLHDNFFAMGGQSLAVSQLSAGILATFQVALPLRSVFEAPDLEALARTIEAARRNPELQEKLTPIPLADRNQRLPLSGAQQRLWFIAQLDPAAAAAYHIAGGLRLRGHLDRAALRAALDRIVERHESLRTTLVNDQGEAVQRIGSAQLGFALTEQDLSRLDPAEQAQAIARQSATEAAAPFDLSAGPLIRGQLLRLAPTEHILLITQHHIVSDGRSMQVLVHELSVLFGAFTRGEPDPLQALSVQYADYSLWQRQWLQGEVLQEQLSFWGAHLRGAPTLLELPTDRPRPRVQSYAGGRVKFALTAQLSAAVKALSQQQGTTLFMTAFAAWSILLSRLSGQNEVVIGTPVANRRRIELEPLIGFFVNTLALRIRLTADLSVTELLGQIKASLLEAYAHQDVPFEQVVEALRPPRSINHSPIFQVLLSMDGTPAAEALNLPGLTLEVLESPHVAAQFDLSLSLSEAHAQITGSLEYASDLFERSTIERLTQHLQSLLGGMVADPGQRVSHLPLLSAAERRQMVVEFNATQVDYPRDQLIHQLFAQQVAQRPRATALICREQSLTYAELNQRANQLAHYLIEQGVRPGDRVALCIDRSPAMVVGLLGILKAGGAYVSLDPQYPPDRLLHMLNDSAAVALVTQATAWDRVPAIAVPVAMLGLSEEDAQIARQPRHDPSVPGLNSAHLSYVIYTSGSTGLPKGTRICHRSVLNLFEGMDRRVGCNSDDVVLALTSMSFDISVLELLWPLARGATIAISSEADLTDTAYSFTELCRRHGVTVIQGTPSRMEAICAEPEVLAALANVRAILVGGEVFTVKLAERLQTALPRARIFNGYGPTETTTYSAMYELRPSSEGTLDKTSLPIGQPVANTQIYVLDEHEQVVPIGVTGEIHIGGAGVSEGYLNRPELTAERFVQDPFNPDRYARLYKTGDLGRWRSDGNLEYLGRNDFQVKIRGFRIELGEIEACLSAYAGVQSSVVLAREDVPGDWHLVAYLTAQTGAELSVAELRRHLSGTLPHYMVPSAFVVLESLPLTPNGKLDRKALPAPGQSAHVTRSYEEPVGEVETTLALLWQELLGLERVGRHDEFFELGGHSLALTKLSFKVKETFGVSLGLIRLYELPVLRQLARHIESVRHKANSKQVTLVLDI